MMIYTTNAQTQKRVEKYEYPTEILMHTTLIEHLISYGDKELGLCIYNTKSRERYVVNFRDVNDITVEFLQKMFYDKIYKITLSLDNFCLWLAGETNNIEVLTVAYKFLVDGQGGTVDWTDVIEEFETLVDSDALDYIKAIV